MNDLEQYTDLDYYQILGVDRNCTLQQICTKYPPPHPATATSPSTTTQPYNTPTPIKPTEPSRNQLKPSMSSTIVVIVLFSLEKKDL